MAWFTREHVVRCLIAVVCFFVLQFVGGCRSSQIVGVNASSESPPPPTDALASLARAPVDVSRLEVLWHAARGDSGTQFGRSVCVFDAASTQGSGRFGLAVAAPGDGLRKMGSVYLLDEADGAIIAVVSDNDTPFRDHAFGWSLSGVSDCDGDGLSDIVIADPPSMRGMGVMATRLHFLGTRTLEVVSTREFEGPAGLGSKIIRVSDRNGDGFDELTVAATFVDPNVVQIRDGRSWSLLEEWAAPFSTGWIDFGYAMCELPGTPDRPAAVVVAAAPPAGHGALFFLREGARAELELSLPACAGEGCRVVTVESLGPDQARYGAERLAVGRVVAGSTSSNACVEVVCLDYRSNRSSEASRETWRWSDVSRGRVEGDEIDIKALSDITGDGQPELAVAYVESEDSVRIVVLDGRNGGVVSSSDGICLGYGGGFGIAARADRERCYLYFAKSNDSEPGDGRRQCGVWKLAIPLASQ